MRSLSASLRFLRRCTWMKSAWALAASAAIAASSALVLSAIYILWLYQRVMGGPPTPVEGPGAARRTMPDLHGRERLVVAPLLALLLVFGFFPQPLLNLITPTVSHTLTTVGRDDPAPAVVVPSTGGGK